MQNTAIAIIGGGHLARALVTGLVRNQHDPQQMMVANPTTDKLVYFRDNLQIQTTTDNCAAARFADVIVLSVKPVHLQQVCMQISDIVKEHQPLIISVAAGVNIASITKWLQTDAALVRAMPNVAAAVSASATALFADAKVSEQQHDIAENIFRAIGLITWCKEEPLLDVVVALSGSGPAYFFLLMDCMVQAAVQMGLAEEVARLLTEQTALGAARYSLETTVSLHELCQSIASPNGTTEQALQVMKRANIHEIVAKAMQAASERSQEIAKHYS